MDRFRFSIRTLLMVIGAVAFYFPFRDVYQTWRYDRFADSNYTYLDCENLCSISDGDSVATVRRLFPSLIEVEPSPTMQRNPGWIPLGTKEQLYRYSFTQYSAFPDQIGFGFFRFRDGQLTSHPKQIYSDAAAMTVARRGKLPTILERMTAAPAYLAGLALILTNLFLFRHLIPLFRGKPASSENPSVDECTNG